MRLVVTGGAGFIGSQLVDNLLQQNHEVFALDNLSWGKKAFLKHNLKNPKFKFIKLDLLDSKKLERNLPSNVDTVFHLAANSDIARGAENPDLDFKNTTQITFNLLQAMRQKKIKKIFFTSGSGVYGDVGDTLTDESFGPLLPISMYGATKLSAEGMISSFVNLFEMQAFILRPANIIGPRATHGVIFDFINRLKANPKKLRVSGNGSQSKSYLYVGDVIEAINLVWQKSKKPINLFNISSDSFITVKEIAEMVVEEMGLEKAEIIYSGESRGWKGDVPIVRIDNKKIENLGWKSKHTSQQAVNKTIKNLLENK
ncbi:MAG TPA: NAD-dependent epimerase/dehydratase family protein [Candidatus Saccharimonadales bacterium]|nr:NAD-dependent epimerase/dehydratase family protein [Candidatus Saccharimonadales bacterium]